MSDLLTRMLVENVQPRPGRGGWHGGPTPIGALRGVSAEQAAWEPAPGRKSIWQLTLHIAYWKYAVRRRLEGGAADRKARFPRTPANWPAVPAAADEGAWRADVALLKTEHERLVAALAAVPVDRYGEVLPGGKRWTVGELILGIAQHDAYHTGQIQMLKRLWVAMRARGGASRT
ncbi:MAG TPA: DinB family protein [Gemmatimonadaceae bacterium]|nr:DinB family protein [Gemmatimonadaceae bacterium]